MAAEPGSELEDALEAGIDLKRNAFLLVHGWTAGPILLEFVERLLAPLSKAPSPVQQLAALTNTKVGPLAIVLRTCTALGYLDCDLETGVYSVVQGPELDWLARCLDPSGAVALALRRIYAEVLPPFRLKSHAATLLIEVWSLHRSTWKSGSRSLAILLDGIVLSPLLTSITYFVRWDEAGLDAGKESCMQNFDFRELDKSSQKVLQSIFCELGVGRGVDESGALAISPKDMLALQRVYAYYVPTSYAPMMARFTHILTEDPAWGFNADASDDDHAELHVQRTLNVVGSGVQHRTLFKDMMRHVEAVFAGDNFAAQPKFVVDTGCGDGHLLLHIYRHIQEHTPRGKVLQDFPLTMIGVDFNEASRVATTMNLTKHEIPHKALFGDIGDPKGIISALKKKKVDTSKSLHVRSFLDHDRPYLPANIQLDEKSAVAAFARAELADFVHLDKSGSPLPKLEVFASLMEHMARWADCLEGSFGICLLEVMMLDVSTTKQFINENVSFHFDIVQCLSRQYMVSSLAFAMGAAMAGLLPADANKVITYPANRPYCRMVSEHLVSSALKIRFAEQRDLPRLLALEEKAWDVQLRASEAVIKTRLEVSPATNLVVELEGQVVAVLYMQRVQNLDVVDTERFMRISESHSPSGRILQLIAICVDPVTSSTGIGSQLRTFGLHLARLDPSVDCVIGVTRCHDFKASCLGLPMQEYVDAHTAGKLSDKTLNFHTAAGAKILRLVPDFRPEDVDNGGCGVLIQYLVKEQTEKVGQRTLVQRPGLDIVSDIMTGLGYKTDLKHLDKGFFEYGIDSLDLVKIRSNVGSMTGLELPSTLLLDFPSVLELAEHIDQARGMHYSRKAGLIIVSDVLTKEGFRIDEKNLGKGFFDYGIDSLEMAKIRSKLSEALGRELPPSMLLDFPSVLELADQLDKDRGLSPAEGQRGNAASQIATQGAASHAADVKEPSDEASSVKQRWEDISVEDLIAFLDKLLKLYAMPRNLKTISDLFAKHGSTPAYFNELAPFMAEVEGPVLLSLGFIEELEPALVKQAREMVAMSLSRHSRRNPEVQRREKELAKLLKRDQP